MHVQLENIRRSDVGVARDRAVLLPAAPICPAELLEHPERRVERERAEHRDAVLSEFERAP